MGTRGNSGLFTDERSGYWRGIMCAALETNGKELRPSRRVGFWESENIAGRLIWAGFARRESLPWWKKKGGRLVDVPAHRFAERSDLDRQLRWDDVPAGLIVRGVIDPNDGKPLLKIVTRESSPEEFARFEHPRMPPIEAQLFRAEILPEVPENPQDEPFRF